MIKRLYLIMLTETVLGGGGRIFQLGPITLRMLLFAACLAMWLVALGYTKKPKGQFLALLLVYSFISSLLCALFVDATSGASLDRILAEIQPLLFWFTAPFVAMAIANNSMVERSSQIIIYGGCLSAVMMLTVMSTLALGLIPFAKFYTWSMASGELFFRGEISFFFKGLFYISIALIFTIVLKPRFWTIISAILALSIAASLTRGLIFSSFITIIGILIYERKLGTLSIIALIVGLISIFYVQDIIDILFRDRSRASSYDTRYADTLNFLEGLDASSLFIGKGAGVLLNGRQAVENTFLWALWKYGLPGVVFWLSPILISYFYFRKIPQQSSFHKLGIAFFFGMLMLYIQTIINPFLNNSIGISYSILSIFSLRLLSRKPAENITSSICRELR